MLPLNPRRLLTVAAGITSWAMLSSTATAEVRLPALIDNGMVIQREAPVKIWGWAAPGESVRVSFRGEIEEATTDKEGRWNVWLAPQSAGGPFQMQVAGSNTIDLEDVYVGDVWLGSGQSNMERDVERSKEIYPDVIATSENPRIRHFKVPMAFAFDAPQEDVQSDGWQPANPENVLNFSAAAYFFAREMEPHLDVPIGIISSAVGGSPIQSWMSEQTLKKYPEDLKEAIRWRDPELRKRTEAKNQEIFAGWDSAVKANDAGIKGSKPWYDPAFQPEGWRTMTLPGLWDEKGLEPMHGVVWFRRTFDLPASMAGKAGMLYLGTIVDADETYLNGLKVGETTYQYPSRRYKVPGGLLKEGENVLVIRAFSQSSRGAFTLDKPFDLVVDGTSLNLRGEWQYQVGAVLESPPPATYMQWKPLGLHNAMIAPLTDYTIKGVLWYQGESSVHQAAQYQGMLTSLVADWRKLWDEPELPFIWVQLPNFMEATDAPSESDWAVLRDGQRKALEIPHTGMAVAIDIGEWNDIHPLDKESVGKRLALEARRVAYGEEDIVSSGPLVESARREDNRVRISFTHIGGGLKAKGGEPLQHFSIAGADGKFVRAEARIETDQVIVWSDQVEVPHKVRYAWAHNPASANLYNKEGLPASPFEIEVEELLK